MDTNLTFSHLMQCLLSFVEKNTAVIAIILGASKKGPQRVAILVSKVGQDAVQVVVVVVVLSRHNHTFRQNVSHSVVKMANILLL